VTRTPNRSRSDGFLAARGIEGFVEVSALASATAEPAAGRCGEKRVEAAELALIRPR
jgi:hypothetical protein